MGTSNIDHFIVSIPEPNIRAQQCKSSSSSSEIPSVLHNENQENQTKINKDANFVTSGLTIKVPSSAGAEGDPKTPKSTKNRIPIMVTCPPAPRKAKRVLMTGKRKATYFPEVRVLADFMVYVDAMLALNETIYVPDIVVGDPGTGDHAKRFKSLPPPAHEP